MVNNVYEINSINASHFYSKGKAETIGKEYERMTTDINNFISSRPRYRDEVFMPFASSYTPIRNDIILEQINRLINAKEIIGIDLEITGAMDMQNGGVSPSFAVTEVGIVKRTNPKNPSKGVNEIIMDLKMGINKPTLNKSLEQTMWRFNGTPFANKIDEEAAKVIELRTPFHLNNVPDVLNINEDLVVKSLLDLSRRPIIYGSPTGKEEVMKVYNTLNKALNSNIPIVGHNILKADAVWLNQMFVDNLGEGFQIDFNRSNTIDTLEIVQAGFKGSLFDVIEDRYYGSDYEGKVLGGQRLETLAKLFGIEQNAHEATSDISANLELLYKRMRGPTSRTFLAEARYNLKNQMEKDNKFISTLVDKDKKILYSNKSFKIDNNSVDVMLDKDGKPMHYRNTATGRGIFYELEDFAFTPFDNLPKHVRESLGEAEGAYSIKLNAIGGETGSSAVITRGSLDELIESIGGYFDVFKVGKTTDVKKNRITIEDAMKQHEYYEKDLARRKFESIFQLGQENGGYNYGQKIYGAFNDLKAGLGKDFNYDNVVKLLDDEENLNKLTGFFSTTEGKAIPERVRDFKNLFHVLEDTNDIIKPIMDEIDKNILPYDVVTNGEDLAKILKDENGNPLSLNAAKEEIEKRVKVEQAREMNERKTKILKDTYSTIVNDIENFSGEKLELSGSLVDDKIMDTHYIDIKVDGEYKSINVASLDQTITSLNSKTFSKFTNETNINNSNIRVTRIKEVARDLMERSEEAGNIGLQFKLHEVAKNQDINDPNVLQRKLAQIIQDNKSLLNNDKKSKVMDGRVLVGDKSAIEYLDENLNEVIQKKYDIVKNPYSREEYILNMTREALTSETRKRNMAVLPSSKMVKRDGEFKLSDSYKKIKSELYDLLSNEMHYNESQIDEVIGRIVGYDSSYINRGYAVSVVGYKNSTGDLEHGILAYFEQDRDHVSKALADGIIPNRSLLQPLPSKSLNVDGTLETIKTGLVETKITESLTSYIDESGDIKYNIDDTLTRSLKASRLSYKKQDELIELGEWEKAKNEVYRISKKNIYEESGASASQTVTLGGKSRKRFIPRVDDILEVTTLDPIIELIPKLYDGNEAISNSIKKQVGLERWEPFYNKINNNLKRGKILNYDEALGNVPEIAEWIKVNLFQGENIIGAILETEGLIEDDKVLRYLRELSVNEHSQLVNKTQGHNITVIKGSPEKYIPGGHLNNPRRPQVNQVGKAVPILFQEIVENAEANGVTDIKTYFREKEAHGLGIRLGDIIRTKDLNTDYFERVGKQFKDEGGIINTIYGGFKQLEPTQLQIEAINFDVDNFIKSYKEKYNENITTDEVQNLLDQYRLRGTTNEQHSYVRPSVDKFVMFNDELGTINIDDEILATLKEGQVIDGNTIIGRKTIGGEVREKLYSGTDGVISFIDEEAGKAFIKYIDPAFEQKKYMIGEFEKTVGTSIVDKNFNLAEELYSSLFGKNTAIVGNFEFGKHETGGGLLTSKMAVVSGFLEGESAENQQAILDIFGKYLEDWDLEMITDNDNNVGEILTYSTPYTETNDLENYKKAFAEIEELAKEDSELGRISKNIVNTTNSYEAENILYMPIKKATLSESMSSANGHSGKGVKVDNRFMQVFGAYYKEGFIDRNANGEWEKITKPIEDMFRAEIKQTKGYDDAVYEMKSIISSFMLEAGEEVPEGIRIKSVNIEDLMLPPSEILTLDTLTESVFGKYKDEADVLKIELKNNTYTNPLTYEREYTKLVEEALQENEYLTKSQRFNIDKIATERAQTNIGFLSMGTANYIDDNEIFYSKNLKNTINVIKDIQMLESGEVSKAGGVSKLKETLDNDIREMYSVLDFEMNNKKGLVNQKISSGRLNSSITLLTTGIADMHFIDGKGEKALHPLAQDSIEVMEDGKIKYHNNAYISKDVILKTGLKDKNVVKQLLDDKNELQVSDRFKQEIKQFYKNDGSGEYGLKTMEEWFENMPSYHEIEPPESYNPFKTKIILGKGKDTDHIKYIEKFQRLKMKDFLKENFGVNSVGEFHNLDGEGVPVFKKWIKGEDALKFPDEPLWHSKIDMGELYEKRPLKTSISDYRKEWIKQEGKKRFNKETLKPSEYKELKKDFYTGGTYDDIIMENEIWQDQMDYARELNIQASDNNKILKKEWADYKEMVKSRNANLYEHVKGSYIFDMPDLQESLNAENAKRYNEWLEDFRAQKDKIRIMDKKRNDVGKAYWEESGEHRDWYERKLDWDEGMKQQYWDYFNKNKAEIDSKIVDKYYESEGIPVLSNRHPTFHNQAIQSTKGKLNKHLKGNEAILSEAIAKNQNADIDGDTNQIIALTTVNENGDVVLMPKNSEVYKSYQKIYDMQTSLNNKYFQKKLDNGEFGVKLDKNGKIISATNTGKNGLDFAITLNDYQEKIKDIYGVEDALDNLNYYTKDASIGTAIKARDNMNAIGNISAKNYVIKNAINNLDTYAGFKAKDLDNIMDLTRITEQKLIDVKHDSVGQLTIAGRYSNAIDKMANSEGNTEILNEGLGDLIGVLNQSTIYDNGYKLPGAKEIINGKFDKSDEFANQIQSLYKAMDTEEVRKAFIDPFNNTGGNPFRGLENSMEIIDNLKENPTSELAKIKHDVVEVILESPAKIIEGTPFISKNITGTNDILRFNGSGEDKNLGLKYLSFKNEDDVKVRMYGTNFNQIQENLNDNFVNRMNLSKEEKANYDNLISRAKNINNAFESVANVDNGQTNILLSDMITDKDVNGGMANLFGDGAIVKLKNLGEPYGLEKDTVAKKALQKIKYADTPEKKISLYDELFKINAIYDSEDKKTLFKGIDEVKKLKEEGVIGKGNANAILENINRDIIERGKKAADKNIFREETIKTNIYNVLDEGLKVKDIGAEIDNLKFIGNADVSNYNSKLVMDASLAFKEKNIDLSNVKHLDSFNNSMGEIQAKNVQAIDDYNFDVMMKQNELFEQVHSRTKGFDSVLNWDNHNMENYKVGFGKYANLKYSDLSLQDLASISNETGFNSKLAIESKANINAYLDILSKQSENRSLKATSPIVTKRTDLSSIIEKNNKVREVIDTESINKEIIKRAETLAERQAVEQMTNNKATTQTIEGLGASIGNAKKWYQNKYIISAGVITGVLGLAAAASSGENYIRSGTVAQKENNGYLSEAKGQEARPQVYQAPDTKRNERSILQGIKMKIKGRSKGDVDTNRMFESMGKAVNNSTNSEVKINANERDSREEVSQNWLESKLSKLFD